MGLVGALVDRARPVVSRPAGPKVDGRTPRREVRGDWFKCRVTLTENPDQVDPATGVRTVVRTPRMLCGTKDTEGNPIVLTSEMRLEVESVELGVQTIFDVAGDPTPLRKKRSLLGWEADLRAVLVHEAVDA